VSDDNKHLALAATASEHRTAINSVPRNTDKLPSN